MTSKVLESDTVFKSALASNIRAFHQAIQQEVEMHHARQEIKEMREEIAELKDMIRDLAGSKQDKKTGNA